MKKAVLEIMCQRKRFPDITLLTYFDVLDEKCTYHHPIDKFNNPCPARKNGFITYGGDFFPCDFLRYSCERFFCGNILDTSFATIWNKSQNLKKFQSLKHIKCQKCKFYMKSCYGGCISGTIASSNDVDDALCFAQN